MGSLKPYEKKIYNKYVEFLEDYFKTNIDIEISFRKPTKRIYFGFIDLIALSKGKYKIIVEHTAYGMLGKIAHEYTHCVQYKEGRLKEASDEQSVYWKGKEYITNKELKKITNFDEYKQLPWEAEAYAMQDMLPKLFKESDYYQELRGIDVNIDFLMDNDAI